MLSDVGFPRAGWRFNESKTMFTKGSRGLIDQIRLKWLGMASCTRISSDAPRCEIGRIVNRPRYGRFG